MGFTETILYEQFVDARRRAVELTDRYNAIPPNDPTRAEAWAHVVRHTETARQLLESWLRTGGDEAGPERAARLAGEAGAALVTGPERSAARSR